MKRNTYLILVILGIGCFACSNGDKTNRGKRTECDSLTQKKVIYRIGNSILENHDDGIWNLSEIDTSEFLTAEDYFISTTAQNRLVLVGGVAGTSAGTANNLLILFSCVDTLRVVWSGQIGEFGLDDIVDLNGDGIKEIVCKTSAMWMGECFSTYDVFNFKDGKQNSIYTARSKSFLDCGGENIGDSHKKGDTLERQFEVSLIKLGDHNFKIHEIKTIKIHNGGENDKEILDKLLVKVDTSDVKIN